MHDAQQIQISLAVIAETSLGDRVYAVGSIPELGEWQPTRAFELYTTPGTYPRWSASCAIRLNTGTCEANQMEYKFITVHSDGSVLWEKGSNRSLLLDSSSKTFDESKLAGTLGPAPRFGETVSNAPHVIQEYPRESAPHASCSPERFYSDCNDGCLSIHVVSNLRNQAVENSEGDLHNKVVENFEVDDASKTVDDRMTWHVPIIGTSILKGNRTGDELDITFAVIVETSPGDRVYAVGSAQELGQWQLANAMELHTDASSYPQWSGSCMFWLNACAIKANLIEYKFVILHSDGSAQWEERTNRSLLLDPSTICYDASKLSSAAALTPRFGETVLNDGCVIEQSYEQSVQPDADTPDKCESGCKNESLDILAVSDVHSESSNLGEKDRCVTCAVNGSMTWHYAILGLKVTFAVIANTSPGEKVCVVGSTPELGQWQPVSALDLRTEPSTYPQWSGTCDFRLNACTFKEKKIEYKFIVLHSDGSVLWEEGPNRSLPLHPSSTSSSGLELPSTSDLVPQFGKTVSDAPHALEHNQNYNTPQDAYDVGQCRFSDCDDDSLSTSALSDLHSDVSDSCESEITIPATVNNDMRFWAGAYRLQKPGGACEDSFFFGSCALGVADGVGQMKNFAAHGVDAAAYAAELMELAAHSLQPSSALATLDAEGSAAAAIAAAEANAVTFGASTITVMCLKGNTIDAASLGDSGFVLLRATPLGGMTIIEQSKEQSHKWNCPYQLTHIPQTLARKVPNDSCFDSAADCDCYAFNVQPGDLLLLFTDGLSDNLHWHEILQTVDAAVMSPTGQAEPTVPPQSVAQALALAAQKRSLDPDSETPFCKNAHRHRQHYLGGKPDDITVVAAWVTPRTMENLGAQDVVLGCAHDANRSRQLH